MKEDLNNIFKQRNTKTVIGYYGRFFVIWLVLLGCGSKQELLNQKPYEGPISRLDSAVTLISDSAKIILKRITPLEETYANGDTEWKKGLYLQLFDEFGEVSSTLKSNYAHYDKAKNLYKGEGNVIVKSITNGDELNTEELFWDPNKKEFFTDRFVTIQSEDEIHKGEGLTANQDFTYYKILKPTGTFTVEETTPTNSQQ